MAFVLEIQTSFKQNYIKNIIATIATRYAINSTITQNNEKIVCAFASKDERLQEALEAIEKELPASLFFKSSKSYENDEEPKELAKIQNDYPLNLGLCPTCQKEMFDVSSKRYYYPFTSCSCCGGVHSFVNSYPYSRQNSSFKFLKPCKVCIDEQNSVGYRHYHEINSCHGCGVPVRLAKKKNERYANDAGSFRTLFEVAAKAIKDDKKLLIKTTFGYRLFYKAQHIKKDSIILMINGHQIELSICQKKKLKFI